MKRTTFLILLILFLSGCATIQGNKPICNKGYVPALCSYCRKNICVKPEFPTTTCFCGKTINTEVAIEQYKEAQEQAKKDAESQRAEAEYKRSKFSGTCNICKRAFSFSQEQYDQKEATPFVCPYCGAKIDDIDMAMKRYDYDRRQEIRNSVTSNPSVNCRTHCDGNGNCWTNCN